MSAITAPMTLDISQTSRIPVARLIKVELRKMVDTRAGMWLMISVALVTAIAITIFGFAGNADEKTFGNFLAFSVVPQNFILPVLGILLVTQEWGQRTGMVTFTLEPHRGRVLTAKICAALLIGISAIIVALAVATLATVIFGSSDFSDMAGIDFLKFGILQISKVVLGLVFGLLFLNSAAAIVVYFVLPIAYSILFNTVSALKDAAPWTDLGTAQGPLTEIGHLTGREWSQLAVASTIWLIIPFLAGLWRVLRAEVK